MKNEVRRIRSEPSIASSSGSSRGKYKKTTNWPTSHNVVQNEMASVKRTGVNKTYSTELLDYLNRYDLSLYRTSTFPRRSRIDLSVDVPCQTRDNVRLKKSQSARNLQKNSVKNVSDVDTTSETIDDSSPRISFRCEESSGCDTVGRTKREVHSTAGSEQPRAEPTPKNDEHSGTESTTENTEHPFTEPTGEHAERTRAEATLENAKHTCTEHMTENAEHQCNEQTTKNAEHTCAEEMTEKAEHQCNEQTTENAEHMTENAEHQCNEQTTKNAEHTCAEEMTEKAEHQCNEQTTENAEHTYTEQMTENAEHEFNEPATQSADGKSTFTSERVNKEHEKLFLNEARKHQMRVTRIRRVLWAAEVIQRSWRQHILRMSSAVT